MEKNHVRNRFGSIYSWRRRWKTMLKHIVCLECKCNEKHWADSVTCEWMDGGTAYWRALAPKSRYIFIYLCVRSSFSVSKSVLALAVIIWHSNIMSRMGDRTREHIRSLGRYWEMHITEIRIISHMLMTPDASENEKSYSPNVCFHLLCVGYYNITQMCVRSPNSLVRAGLSLCLLRWVIIIYKIVDNWFSSETERIVFSPFDVVTANASFRWDQI